MACPLCQTTEHTEPLDNGMWYCPTCNHAWQPPPRLPEPRRRRDTDE